MHQTTRELQCLLSAVVRLNSLIMVHTNKEPERRDEGLVLHQHLQFKDRHDLRQCVLPHSLHLHHQSQTILEVGVKVIRLPHHHQQCNLSQRLVNFMIVVIKLKTTSQYVSLIYIIFFLFFQTLAKCPQ